MKVNARYSIHDNNPLLYSVLASLNQISVSINSIVPGNMGSGDKSLQLIVESAIRVVPGSSAVIYTYDENREAFENESRVSAEPKGRTRFNADSHPSDQPRINGIGKRAITRRRSVISYEEPDLEVHPIHAALGVKAVGCFPLIIAEQRVGVLYIYLYEEREFTLLERLMLDNFVNQAAMSIYHTRRLIEMQLDLLRKEEELKRLHQAGMLISSRLRLEETLESILQLALEMTNAQYGIFRLLDKSGQLLITKAFAGAELNRPLIEELPLTINSVMGQVAKSRLPILIPDLLAKPWSEIYYPLDASTEMRSELAIPLINASGRLEGVLNLESPLVAAFTENDRYMLQSLATFAVTAIQEVRLLDALQEVAQLLLSQPCQRVLEHLSGVARDLLNASASAIWLLNDKKNELILKTSCGSFQQMDVTPVDGSRAGQAVILHEPIVANDLGEWTRALIVPLLIGDSSQSIGAFGVYSSEVDPGRFAESAWDKKVMTFLANYAVLAVQNDARQQDLRAAQERQAVAETFAAVGDVASNLLHNLNNKVGTIPVRVQNIEDKCKAALDADPYLKNNLIEIERCAMDAMQTVSENLSHLRPIRLEPVLVDSHVMDAIRTVKLPAGIHIQTKGIDLLPAVMAGKQSLVFVFANLLENAVDAMNGKGIIEIKGHTEPEFVEILIIDNGPGISPDLHEHIFELNFSGRSNTRPGKLGFGLWWVKTLMTRLGGSIYVESEGYQGTTFRLRLPRAKEIK